MKVLVVRKIPAVFRQFDDFNVPYQKKNLQNFYQLVDILFSSRGEKG